VSKNAAHPCIMHAAAVGLNYSRLSVEWRALRQLNSTLARALSSHTFNNESPCRPINNLCPSVANQPSQKPSRPADRVVVIFECVRRVHCDARCVLAVCVPNSLSLSLSLWYTAVIIINIYGADDEHASAINRLSAPANLKFAKRRARVPPTTKI
jgi:hypothetical protein